MAESFGKNIPCSYVFIYLNIQIAYEPIQSLIRLPVLETSWS